MLSKFKNLNENKIILNKKAGKTVLRSLNSSIPMCESKYDLTLERKLERSKLAKVALFFPGFTERDFLELKLLSSLEKKELTKLLK